MTYDPLGEWYNEIKENGNTYPVFQFNTGFNLDVITLGCGISINSSTGEVKVPEHLTLDQASKEFWDAMNLFQKGFKSL